MSELQRILVIRRDNIGDLVCTTPLIAALRSRYPQSWIGALVNSYNAPVLEGNSDLDAVFSYEKLKHRDGQGSLLRTIAGAVVERYLLIRSLRAQKLDCVAIATTSYVERTVNLAARLHPKTIAGFVDGKCRDARVRLPVPEETTTGLHEVEAVYRLAPLLGVETPIPPLKIVPSPDALVKARAAIGQAGFAGRMLIGVHISARRPAQRWPTGRYAELIVQLKERFGAASVLFWSPGAQTDPRHPGDDEKAAEVVKQVGTRAPLLAYSTTELRDLIGALSVCDAVICPDGGAMHLAAALGRPIVALFGDSPPERWRPWGVRHTVIQTPSRNVSDIAVDAVVRTFTALLPAARG
ncbi:MAG: glycosyltransferase family 9 protein [Betaproteobacteria bacterium]|nr:glycosyltransferase family 9 protein [Betaproteobacteria bacterium]